MFLINFVNKIVGHNRSQLENLILTRYPLQGHCDAKHCIDQHEPVDKGKLRLTPGGLVILLFPFSVGVQATLHACLTPCMVRCGWKPVLPSQLHTILSCLDLLECKNCLKYSF